ASAHSVVRENLYQYSSVAVRNRRRVCRPMSRNARYPSMRSTNAAGLVVPIGAALLALGMYGREIGDQARLLRVRASSLRGESSQGNRSVALAFRRGPHARKRMAPR